MLSQNVTRMAEESSEEDSQFPKVKVRLFDIFRDTKTWVDVPHRTTVAKLTVHIRTLVLGRMAQE
jgi:hypothetical protein